MTAGISPIGQTNPNEQTNPIEQTPTIEQTSPTTGHTHCPYCALQCAMTVTPAAGGPEVAPAWFPTNRGGLCRKGWTSASLLDHPERLTSPLIRRDGRLEPCDWDTALDRVVDGIRRARVAGGPDGVAVFGG